MEEMNSKDRVTELSGQHHLVKIDITFSSEKKTETDGEEKSFLLYIIVREKTGRFFYVLFLSKYKYDRLINIGKHGNEFIENLKFYKCKNNKKT